MTKIRFHVAFEFQFRDESKTGEQPVVLMALSNFNFVTKVKQVNNQSC